MEEPLETYIVRIYRREPGVPSQLAGMVEEPGCPGKKPFTDIDELLSIISKENFTRQKEKRKGAPESSKRRSKQKLYGQ